MKQLIPFDPLKGGNEAGLCLKNTRLGYGIEPLFKNAITAWLNTEQHPDRNFPALDVPVYFTYKEDGHIGVRLKNGQFWSDGKTYSSLEAYENAPNRPKFVGWGESVNEVKVISIEENDMPNEGDVDNVYLMFNGRKATSEEKKVYTGKSWSAGDGLFYGKVQPEVENLERALEQERKGYEQINEPVFRRRQA